MSETEELDETLFPNALAPFRKTLVCKRERHCRSSPDPDLLDLPDVLARFQRSTGGAWQPACSFWAQRYFNTLLIPATCLVSADAERMPWVAAVSASVCPISGIPLQGVMHAIDSDQPGCHAGRELAECLARHIDAVIGDLITVGRLSRGLLRESAERVFAWTIREIRFADAVRAQAAAARLSRHGWCRSGLCAGAGAIPVRRFCCLRDRLPNIASCCDTCPRGTERPRPARAGGLVETTAKAHADPIGKHHGCRRPE